MGRKESAQEEKRGRHSLQLSHADWLPFSLAAVEGSAQTKMAAAFSFPFSVAVGKYKKVQIQKRKQKCTTPPGRWLAWKHGSEPRTDSITLRVLLCEYYGVGFYEKKNLPP